MSWTTSHQGGITASSTAKPRPTRADQILEALFDPCLQALQAIDAPPGGEQAREVLEQVMDVFAERGTALQAVMNDRSAMQHVGADRLRESSQPDHAAARGQTTPPTCFVRGAPSVPCSVAC